MINYKTKRLVKNTVIFMIGNLGTKIIQFLLVPLYTYTLTSEQYGDTEIVLSTVSFLIPIFSMSISDALLRYGLDKDNKPGEALKNGFVIVSFGGLLASMCLPVILKYNTVLNKWSKYVVIILVCRMIRDVFAINLKIIDKNVFFAIDGMVYTLALSVFSVVFLSVFDMGVMGYLSSQLYAVIISILFLTIVGRPISAVFHSQTNYHLLKEMLLYSLPMVPNAVAWWVITISDRFIIQLNLNVSDVGIYAVATKLPTIILTITGLFNQAWIISSAIEYDNEDDGGFYTDVFKVYTAVLFFVVFILQMILKPFLHLYVSPNYYSALNSAYILVCSASLSCIASFLVGIYTAAKRNIKIMLSTLIGAIVNIGLNFILISKIGVMGAAVSTLISWTIIAIMRLIGVEQISKIKVEYKRVLIYGFASLLQCISFIVFDYFGYIISGIVMFIWVLQERRIIKSFYRSLRLLFRDLVFVRKNRKRLINNQFSIIASDCTGGIIYHDLKHQFTSPTINLYIDAKDYITFCSDLRYWVNQPLKEVKTDLPYPIAELGNGDVKLHFVHYKTFEDAKEKWDRRKERIDYDNLYFIFNDRNGCSREDMIAFDNFKYKHKVLFVGTKIDNIKSAFYIKNAKNMQTAPTMSDWISVISIRRYIDMFDYTKWINGEEL